MDLDTVEIRIMGTTQRIDAVRTETEVNGKKAEAALGPDGFITVAEKGYTIGNGDKEIIEYSKGDQQQVLQDLLTRWKELDRPKGWHPVKNYTMYYDKSKRIN